MFVRKKSALWLLSLLMAATVFGQQTSKSKSKSKLYEKDGENKSVRVYNCTEINSKSSDYSPAFYQNGIVYVSSRKTKGERDPKTGETFYELYFAPFDPNGEPVSPSQFSLQINHPGTHEGPLTFSRDWQTLFFTRNNMRNGATKADQQGNIRLKIYESRRFLGDWGTPREMPFNSDTYSCMHPTLSADGSTMYFASDMPGGYGGLDLYETHRTNDDGWSVPQNLGATINTEKNEVFPFIHASGTLFFSSTGHRTLGGMDVFFADLTLPADEMEVVNIGEPFNSASDDLGFIMNDDRTGGFFSSDRGPTFGKDDVYKFSVEQGLSGVRKPESRQMRLTVLDEETGRAVQGAEVRILQPHEDGFSSNSDTTDIYEMDLEPLESSGNTLNMRLVRKKAEVIGNADHLTNAAGEALADFMEYRTYLLVVTAPGFKPSDKFLSLDPASRDLNTAVTIGLKSTHGCVSVSGKVVTSQFGSPIYDAVLYFTNKETNRREIARTNMNGGFEACLPAAGEYAVQAEKNGYQTEIATVTARKDRENLPEIRLRPALGRPDGTPPPGPLKDGDVIIMEKIYYEPNRATLNESATNHLNELIRLMRRYPEMEIDLVSHTDSRGDARANLALSQARADNAKRYMVTCGIAERRINAIGKGETQVRNQCTDGVECSEAEHQYNRRTEVNLRKVGLPAATN